MGWSPPYENWGHYSHPVRGLPWYHDGITTRGTVTWLWMTIAHMILASWGFFHHGIWMYLGFVPHLNQAKLQLDNLHHDALLPYSSCKLLHVDQGVLVLFFFKGLQCFKTCVWKRIILILRRVHIHIHIYIHMYICIYIYMHTHIYIYICTFKT